MRKILFFGFALLLLTGCSEKTIYPQVTGEINTKKPAHINVNFNKEILLDEVSAKANEVFEKINKKRKSILKLEKNIIINSIYKAGEMQ